MLHVTERPHFNKGTRGPLMVSGLLFLCFLSGCTIDVSIHGPTEAPGVLAMYSSPSSGIQSSITDQNYKVITSVGEPFQSNARTPAGYSVKVSVSSVLETQ